MSNPLTVTVDTYSALSFSSSTSFAPSALPPSSAPSLSSTPSTTTDSNGQTSTTPATTSTTPTTTSMTFVPTTVPVVIMFVLSYLMSFTLNKCIRINSHHHNRDIHNNLNPCLNFLFLFHKQLIKHRPNCRWRSRWYRRDCHLRSAHLLLTPSHKASRVRWQLWPRSGWDSPPNHPYTDHGSSMRQYGESPFLPAGAAAGAAAAASINRTTLPLSSPSQYSDTATTAANGYPSQGFIRPGPGRYPQGGPNMYSMKEREAASGRQGLDLATQQEVDGEGSGVVQHQDAGRVHSEEGEPRDIPPAYDSIWQ
ncbi:hypothetical protein DFJ58DRAFT_816666 [Suillus subalutaceus]|uniref:uncharacterized protein n=1 Tax=Suillus subalutaceus TaxID=48586 RepID=UPI001B860CAC|nr:uncharacterized protein DFJ58DRAFT_816666 [Suillus subalutaceus]KAG1837095.1 hypothetical protein DFJ58DRAFT_816666 [Suillus subalutaceus]